MKTGRRRGGVRGRAGPAGAAALLLALAGAPPGWAQGGGSLSGVVQDAAGRPLAQAQVVVFPSGRGTLSDARGRFRVGPLDGGVHRVRVSLIGYAPVQREVRLGAGEAAEVRVRMEETALSLPGLQVTASPGSRDPSAVAQATAQLAGRALERELGSTVAQSLRAQPGVAVRSMGPAAAMPVLRGLTGDRVLVLHDGQRTADLAGSADDHGMTIDPLAAQRVEVVRGPATLLYGNNALGGVVNVISGDLPLQAPLEPEWGAGLQAESAYPGVAGSLRAHLPAGAGWSVAARGGGRMADDVRIPDHPVLGDRLENTALRSWSGALGVGRTGERATGGGAARAYGFRYGLPVAPGSDPVELRGWRREGVGRWERELGAAGLTSARVDATAQEYAHDEVDVRSGEVAQSFRLGTRTAGLLVRQGRLGPFSEGAWGVAGLLKEYSAAGPAALTPPADSRGVGVFGFQELPLGIGGAALQLGGRYDWYRVASRAAPKFGPGVPRTFRAASGSVGLTAPLGTGVSLGANLARSFRAPTVEELFSGAAHAGTGAVELGNPGLDAERGRSVEVVLRAQRERWQLQLAAYHNAVDGFVHLVAEGDSLVDGARLPVLRYHGGAAVLRGVEGSAEWAVRRDLVLGAMGDYLHAGRRDGTPLSYMPPPRLGALARWEPGPFSLGADVHHELRQDRVGAADELPTPAHTTLRLTAGVRLAAGGRVHSLSLRGENLTDELHREATSRIKDWAPGPGRNLALLYRLIF